MAKESKQSPESQAEIQALKKKIENLEMLLHKDSYSNLDIIRKQIQFKSNVSFRDNPAVITGGSATVDAAIKTDVGTLPPGSIYISSNGAGEIWIMQTTTWTKLTIS